MEAVERETVVTYSDADGGVAHIFTAQERVINWIARHPRAKNVVVSDTEGWGRSAEADLPAGDALRMFPRKGLRKLTDEQRKAIGARLHSRRRPRTATLAPRPTYPE